MTPTETAQRYVELFNANRMGDMGRLFAEDGLWVPPNGTPPTRGREAIIAGYEALTEQVASMTFTQVRYYQDGNVAIAEMISMSPNGPTGRVADVFECNENGEILRMTGYSGPAPM
ncbi:MAG: nuclear transport factor 2 family protein [Actinomycetota bacterium]|nr:nuclear transport factor 2 family protein [Actinomycetota bacterium]